MGRRDVRHEEEGPARSTEPRPRRPLRTAEPTRPEPEGTRRRASTRTCRSAAARSSSSGGPCVSSSDDGGTDLAAALTYYSVLAIFPGLIALLALVGVFGQARGVGRHDPRDPRARSSPATPPWTPSRPTLDELAATPGRRRSRWSSVCVGALWSASGYVGAFSRAMNRIYEVEEGRPFWRMRPDAADRHGHHRRPVRGRAGDPDRLGPGRRVDRQRHRASATTWSWSGTTRSGRCSRWW